MSKLFGVSAWNLKRLIVALFLGSVGCLGIAAQADSDDWLNVDIDSSASTLQHTVTTAELLGNNSGTDFRIRGTVEISSSMRNRNIYAYLSKTILPLSRGNAKANVTLSGTIGSSPISTLPVRINFANRQAQIDITGQIAPGQLNMSLPPGIYSGMLTITAITL